MLTLKLHLDNEAVRKLQAKAEQLGTRVEDLVTELVLRSIEDDERYRAAVRDGIAQADVGALVDIDDAIDRVRAKLRGMKAGSSP